MASFDLGSLYQKLTLDISDFKQKMGEALKMTSQQATAQVRAAATGRNAVDKAEREMQKLREWNEKSRLKAQREADIALAKRVQQELRGQHEISNGWRRSITNFRELIMQYFAVESAIRLVEGAMRKVVDLSRSVISAFSELEDFDSPISIALSQADNHIANTKEGVLEIVMALKLAAAEIGTTTDALLPMVTNMLRAGFAANQSINFAQKMKLLIDSFGQGSVRMTQMWALLRGGLEESGQLAGILGYTSMKLLRHLGGVTLSESWPSLMKN
jgi:hypothetical protein